jgi:hypothetical protein
VAAAKTAGVGRLVYMSGAGAAPTLQTLVPGQVARRGGVRGSGIVYTIFRPSWIYGPGDQSLNRFMGFSRWLPFIPQIGNGKQRLRPYSSTTWARSWRCARHACRDNVPLRSWRPGHADDGRRHPRTALRVMGRRRRFFTRRSC